jgi:hypothetical protein
LANGVTRVTNANTTTPRLPSIVQLMFGDGTPKSALLTAMIVGSILTAINHGDTIATGDWPAELKIILTYLTPYCVTTWGAVVGKRAQWRRDNSKEIQLNTEW